MRSSEVLLGLGLMLGGAVTGCGFRSQDQTGDPAGDSGPDVPGACASFASLIDTCQLAFEGDLTLTGKNTYDTMSHVFTAGGAVIPVAQTVVSIGGDEVDVIFARNVRLATSASLRATGPRALAIVASDTLTVEADAQIDVSDGGAGAQATCANGATAGASDGGGAGGGGGGGYGADGGDGGEGNSDRIGPNIRGGAKGHAVAAVPAGLHGGCPGANGGNGDAPGGAGGRGGGALYVVAARRIQLDSTGPLAAVGGGGHGGQHATGGDAGGGGGGAGGMLVVEAPHILGPDATISVNGGGGGGGSDSDAVGGDGNPGTLTTGPADGGAGAAASGVSGGAGGCREAPPGQSVTTVRAGGGGGGGGGVGFLRILSSDVTLKAASPEPR